MSSMNRLSLLAELRVAVLEDEGFMSRAIDTMIGALEFKRYEACERAADMEVALSLVLAGRFRADHEFLRQKLAKWRDRSALNWDRYFQDAEPPK